MRRAAENVGVERKNCWRLMDMQRGGRKRVHSLSLNQRCSFLSGMRPAESRLRLTRLRFTLSESHYAAEC